MVRLETIRSIKAAKKLKAPEHFCSGASTCHGFDINNFKKG
jgi:hypothetical protein